MASAMPKGQKARKKTMTNVMAEVRIAKKNLMPKQWTFGQCYRINGEQSNQWQFEALCSLEIQIDLPVRKKKMFQ